MKVAIFSHTLRRGGLEKIVALLSVGLKERGHHVMVISAQGPVEYRDIFSAAQIEPIVINEGKPPYFWTNIYSTAKKLRAMIRDFSPDTTIVWGGQAIIVARISGIRNLMFGAQNSAGVHWASRRPGHVLLALVERWAMRHKELRVIACTSSVAVSYSQRFKIDNRNIKVVPNATDVENFITEERSLDPASCITILCVGTIYFQKNFEMAIRGLRLLLDSGIKAELHIAGDGPGRIELERLCTSRGLSNAVKFLGVRTDIPQLMKSAQIFWFPSRYEGFGLVAAEAMASRLPVVATRVPGIIDVVSDLKTGLLVPLDDDAALVSATIRLISDDKLRTSIVAQAFELAVNEYSPRKMSERYESILSDFR